MSSIMRSQPPRGNVLAHAAGNLRRLRQRAGLSQAALAEASGISRRMIVGVETGETNVSLSSLDRLAEALGASFVELVADPAATPERIEAVAWRGDQADSQAVLLASAPARREAQLWLWTLGPGERYAAEPDPPGWHEMVFVIEGELFLEIEGGTRRIAAGDFAVYSSAQAYAYAAAQRTRFLRNVIS
jgi:transcriptional regulator with XRE-family HTH domain